MNTIYLYKRIQVAFWAILCLFATTSCTDEAAIKPGGNPENPTEVPEGMSALRVSFIAPGNKAKSYADLNQKGTVLENQIDSISIFLFDNNKLDTLVNVYTVPNPAAGQDTVVLIAERSDKVHLVAVANPADSLVTNHWLPYINVIDLKDFEKLTTLHHDSMPRPSFIMTAYNKGNATVDLSGTTIASAEFELTRLVARIDILNRDSVGLLHTFELQRARMVNIPSQAYLLPNLTDRAAAPNMAKKLKNLDWVDIDASDGSDGKMESQLYMYPAGNGTDDSDVALEIEGLYNGTEAKYSIPFESRKILPNHRYVVTLDSITPVTIIASITMVDWETDTIKFNPDNGGAPTVTFDISGVNNVTAPVKKNVYEYDSIKIATTGSRQIVFTVKDSIANPTFSTTADWITYTETPVSYATVGFAKKYTVTFTENNFGNVRNALIHFVNPANPTKRVTYRVIQKSDNLLIKWAKGNLRDIGSDNWMELTADNAGTKSTAVYGAIFQWGRNYAFPSVLEANPDTSYIPVVSNNTANTNFVTTYPWHSETGTGNDTWTNIAGTIKAKDVCPTGWHVPTKAEFNTLTTGSWIAGGSWSTGQYQIIGNYAVCWKWVPVSGSSAYTEVKVLPVAANGITVANIVGHPLWSNPNVETRYFPAAFHRGYNSGDPFPGAPRGDYWTSTAFNTDDAYFLRLSIDHADLPSSSRSYGFSIRCVQD